MGNAPSGITPNETLAPFSGGFGNAETGVSTPLLYPPNQAPRSQLISPQAVELLRDELAAERAANNGKLPYSSSLLTSLGLSASPGLQLTETPDLPEIEAAPEAVGLVDPAPETSDRAEKAPTPEDAGGRAAEGTPAGDAENLPDGKVAEGDVSPDQTAAQTEKKKKKANKTNKKQKNKQVASLPEKELNDKIATIVFSGDATELSPKDKEVLTDLAQRLNDNTEMRLELLAYADGEAEGANTARRLSLSRALVVRRFLTDQGIAANRLQVRALGDQSIEGDPDRVDILPQGG